MEQLLSRDKVRRFMQIAGQKVGKDIELCSAEDRKLGAQLLLSEVLEYVVHGLGVVPEMNGTPLDQPNSLTYKEASRPDKTEMLDGLADVAFTMYWNAIAFDTPLEQGFDLVCDNNLEKFIELDDHSSPSSPVPREKWDCGKNTTWPEEVVKVEVVKVDGRPYAVGKDKSGKVRKPQGFSSVNLSQLLTNSQKS